MATKLLIVRSQKLYQISQKFKIKFKTLLVKNGFGFKIFRGYSQLAINQQKILKDKPD
jgi:hypothetical protein